LVTHQAILRSVPAPACNRGGGRSDLQTVKSKQAPESSRAQGSVATLRDPHDAQIKNYARVADSIVGWGSKLGTWSRLENHSVIGEDVFVRDEVLLNGAIVLPHKVSSTELERGATEACAMRGAVEILVWWGEPLERV